MAHDDGDQLACVRAAVAAAPGAEPHDVAEAVGALLAVIRRVLAAGDDSSISSSVVDACEPLLRAEFTPRALDTAVVCAGAPVSIASLLALLRLRLDLGQHEAEWCDPDAQVCLSDLLPVEGGGDHFDAVVAGGDDVGILFFPLRRTMALLAALQRVWHLEAGADYDLGNTVMWAARRVALLTAFEFTGDTLDMPHYRVDVDTSTAVLEPKYVANAALLWDVAALLRPMWCHLDDHAARGPPPDYDGDPYDDKPLREHVHRCVFRMHGDRLPSVYARCVVAREMRIGHAAWYQRRCPRVIASGETPLPMDVLRVCCGDAYAKAAHDRSNRPLPEVVAHDALEPALVEACCEYYAGQKDLPWAGGVVWVPVRCRWAARVTDRGARECCASYAQAVLHFVAHAWRGKDALGGGVI